MKELPINFVCTYEGCDKQFSYKSHYLRHLKIHTQQRDFVCLICQKSFKRKDALTIHENKHKIDEEKPYECLFEHCKKKFPSKSGLRYHMLKHESNACFQCDEQNCKKHFLTLGQLNQHIKKTKKHSSSNYLFKLDNFDRHSQNESTDDYSEELKKQFDLLCCSQGTETGCQNSSNQRHQQNDTAVKIGENSSIINNNNNNNIVNNNNTNNNSGEMSFQRYRYSLPRSSAGNGPIRGSIGFCAPKESGTGCENGEKLIGNGEYFFNIANYQNSMGSSLTFLDETPFGMLKQELEFVVGCVEDMKKQENVIVDEKIKTAVHFFNQLRQSGGNLSFDLNEIEEGRKSYQIRAAASRASNSEKELSRGSIREEQQNFCKISSSIDDFVDGCYVLENQNIITCDPENQNFFSQELIGLELY